MRTLNLKTYLSKESVYSITASYIIPLLFMLKLKKLKNLKKKKKNKKKKLMVTHSAVW